MNTTPSLSSLKAKASKYDDMEEQDKHDFLIASYSTLGLSYRTIGEMCGKHGNTIRRDIMKFKIPMRTRGEAQQTAISNGKPHPTKGKKHSDSARLKISEGVSTAWATLSPEEIEVKKQMGKDRWERMSEQEKADFVTKAGNAVRIAAKEGSKLEKFVFAKLMEEGFKPQFHVERTIKNENLQIDILLPYHKVAIEIDGPSHFLPIWGEDTLARNRKADQVKNGLLLGTGFCVIRIRQSKKNISAKYKRDLWTELEGILNNIQASFPAREDRYIILGEKDGE